MAIPQVVKKYTAEEYYVLERAAQYKSEFYQGEIFAMSGGSGRHSKISLNVAGEVRQLLKNKPCEPYESNLRLKIDFNGLRTYPDASVFCEPVIYDPQDDGIETAVNPTVVFEVLSPSTEAYDRGFKCQSYRRIPSLKACVLVSQDRPHVEVYERTSGSTWSFREVDGIEASLSIGCLSIELPLAEIYRTVTFDPEVNPLAERSER